MIKFNILEFWHESVLNVQLKDSLNVGRLSSSTRYPKVIALIIIISMTISSLWEPVSASGSSGSSKNHVNKALDCKVQQKIKMVQKIQLLIQHPSILLDQFLPLKEVFPFLILLHMISSFMIIPSQPFITS